MSFLCDRILGYILTRDVIKPQPKKIESILALKPPMKVKELRSFLARSNITEIYGKKCSHMCVPLTDLVGECGYSKLDKSQQKRNLP
jgi:hypothetical protein